MCPQKWMLFLYLNELIFKLDLIPIFLYSYINSYIKAHWSIDNDRCSISISNTCYQICKISYSTSLKSNATIIELFCCRCRQQIRSFFYCKCPKSGGKKVFESPCSILMSEKILIWTKMPRNGLKCAQFRLRGHAIWTCFHATKNNISSKSSKTEVRCISLNKGQHSVKSFDAITKIDVNPYSRIAWIDVLYLFLVFSTKQNKSIPTKIDLL